MKKIRKFGTALLILLMGSVFFYSCRFFKKKEKEVVIYPDFKADSSNKNTQFGLTVYDLYKGLEKTESEKVINWAKEQNELTNSYFSNLSETEAAEVRIEQLFQFKRYENAKRDGKYYLLTINDPTVPVEKIYITEASNYKPTLLINPMEIYGSNKYKLNSFCIALDGSKIAFSMKNLKSGEEEILFKSLTDGKTMEDRLTAAPSTGVAWIEYGLLYNANYNSGNKNIANAVYLHVPGTNQKEDKLIYKNEKNPEIRNYALRSFDNKYMVINSIDSKMGSEVIYTNLNEKLNNPFKTLLPYSTNHNVYIDTDSNDFFILTNENAPNYKLITVNPLTGKTTTFIEQDSSELLKISLVQNRIIAVYLNHATSLIKVFDRKGKFLYKVELPDIGIVQGFRGRNYDQDVLYTFKSINQPNQIFKFDVKNNKSELLEKQELIFNPIEFATEKIIFKSKDGTEIPMLLNYKKGLKKDGQNPVFVWGFGAMGQKWLPEFSYSKVYFIEKGGIFVWPYLRGGSEYGEKWHRQGSLLNQKNSAEDLLAAVHYLIDQKYTSKGKIAAGSTGPGCAVLSLAVNTEPELFDVTVFSGGLFDLLSLNREKQCECLKDDFGNPSDSIHYKNLAKLSPIHNINPNKQYPAMYIEHNIHDDFISVSNSYKYAASMQNLSNTKGPVILYIDNELQTGRPEQEIKTRTYRWAFITHHLGIK